jgi:hypothetical protein
VNPARVKITLFERVKRVAQIRSYAIHASFIVFPQSRGHLC